jgi:hypothetical protein
LQFWVATPSARLGYIRETTKQTKTLAGNQMGCSKDFN